MSKSRVIVAAFGDRSALAESIVEGLTDAWPATPPPLFRLACGSGLELREIEEHDALILLARGAEDEKAALSLLALAEEACVPVLALLDEVPAGDNSYELCNTPRLDFDERPELKWYELPFTMSDGGCESLWALATVD